MKKIDVRGQRFGERVAIKDAGRNNYGQVLWLTRCDCGREDLVISTVLKRTQCCRDCQMRPFKKHGDNKNRMYKIWHGMHIRCNKKSEKSYKWYGALGIKVCSEWKDYLKFKEWSLANGYADNLTIDRIDNDGNYEPSNCQWITIQEQNVAGKKRIKTNNSSGVTGVYYRKDTNKWFAGVGKGKKFIRSACFDTKEKAIAARKELRLQG